MNAAASLLALKPGDDSDDDAKRTRFRGFRQAILISPDLPTRAEPAAPIDRLWSLDVSPAPSRSDPRRGGVGSCGAVMGVPRAAEARRGAGGPCSSTDEPIQTEPVSPLERVGSRDGSPAISWPGMDHGSVDVSTGASLSLLAAGTVGVSLSSQPRAIRRKLSDQTKLHNPKVVYG